eukprot:TRINITY_DN7411_c0_g1_i1.p1 TRINITY_DN7411_c0_g1~~TRINITY_DN7411_c0_g1_i1.p1  ORF type:complete len:880 (+),score=312.53 TRINITY_DN7411_c0_g1_i1:260-2641(+)
MALDDGIQFCWPKDREFDGTSTHHNWNNNYVAIVGATEIPAALDNRRVISWDEIGVSVQYGNGQQTMISHLVQGSPYMTFQYNLATPNITLLPGVVFTSISNSPISGGSPVSVTGTTFKVTVSTGITWKIYVLGGNQETFVATSTEITGPSEFTGTIRIAALNQQSGQSFPDTESLLDQYSSTYATGANISYQIVNDNSANLFFDWNVAEGNPSDLLILTWPHHRIVLQSPDLQEHIQYLGIKGYQIANIGAKWTMNYDIPSIAFHPPRGFDTSCVDLLNKYLDYDVSQVVPSIPGDFYFAGKALARTARFLVIADELGRTDLIPTILSLLQADFEPWVNGSSRAPPGYETLWGGLVDASSVSNVNIDFGNGFYQDHHFHYGYHLYAAAVIAKYDPSWLTQKTYQSYVDELARDIGNPSSLDPFYPVSRHKDWYAGHSWAGGIGYNGGTRDEESSSEAMNCYYSLYLWGISTNNAIMQDFARILFATEIHAVRSYWHLYPNITEDTPYPEDGMRALTSVGQIMNEQAGAWLWWGGLKTEIASIQLLPITPITEYVADVAWVQGLVPHCSSEFSNPANDPWSTYVYMANAVLNPREAFLQLQSATATDGGNSFTNSMWWISTRAGTDGQTCSGSPYIVSNTSSVLLRVKTGGYLSITATNEITTVANEQEASAFNLGWTTAGYTIQSVVSHLFATSDQSGDPVSVIRSVASSWEIFRFQEINGYYAVKAGSNGLYLDIPASGFLTATIPNIGNLTDSSLFSIYCQNGAQSCSTTSKFTPPSVISADRQTTISIV